MKGVLKRILHGVFLVLAFPMALVAAFGRFRGGFRFFAQCCAFAPGLPGDYLRIAYYKLTLEDCDLEGRIQFGSFFVHPEVRFSKMAYVGCYCVLGRVSIGERAQIASSVQVLSGRRQHNRDQQGRILPADLTTYEVITVGADSWIGAGALVMADVGAGATVGAGSVVVKPIPPHCTAVGNPARILESRRED